MNGLNVLGRAVLVLSVVFFASGTARAQDGGDWGEGAAPAPAPVVSGGGQRVDNPRFRRGVAFTLGGEFVPDANFTATMYGLDARLGVQINHLLGIYTQTHLSFGSAGGSFGSGSTGTFGFFVIGDVTFSDMFFAGGGLGYAIFNNPGGMALAFRGGVYPLKSAPSDSALRRGLMISLETRIVFLGDPYGTGMQVMGAIGYEAF